MVVVVVVKVVVVVVVVVVHSLTRSLVLRWFVAVAVADVFRCVAVGHCDGVVVGGLD